MGSLKASVQTHLWARVQGAARGVWDINHATWTVS